MGLFFPLDGVQFCHSHIFFSFFDPDSAVVHWKPRPIYEEKKSGFNRDSANESTSQGRKGQKKGTFSAPLLLKMLIIIPAGALAVHVLHQYVCRR